MRILLALLLLAPLAARAEDPAVALGRALVLAPLCGLRDGTWAADLRRGTEAQGGGQAMDWAEGEAVEDFAEAPQAATCGPLATSPDLARADAMVQAWRTAHRPAS